MMEHFRASGLIEGLVASYLFEKEGVLQSLIHELKYGGLSGIGVTLGEHLGIRIARACRGVPIIGVIPVPLHGAKKRERGYNQSEYICQGIARVTGLPVLTSVLKRTKYTKSQTQLNLTERMENVSNAFAVHRTRAACLENATVLLVDDVITTGATIISCAKALKDKGAHRVLACSVALAHKSGLP